MLPLMFLVGYIVVAATDNVLAGLACILLGLILDYCE